MVGGILICTCCPWGNLKGKAAGGCDLEKQDRLWSEPFGAGYNAGGECEAVFSVREGVRRYSQCMRKNGVKGLVTSIGTYGYI